MRRHTLPIFGIATLALFALLAIPATANVGIKATYSDTANLFSLMDNVSGWQEGLTDPAYRQEWTKRFGWSTEDQRWADRYRDYRRRTYLDNLDSQRPSDSPDGMFIRASSETTDPLAVHFFHMDSVEGAVTSFRDIPSHPDRVMLIGFYRHFKPTWRKLLLESAPLTQSASRLAQQIGSPNVSAFVEHVSNFYHVQTNGVFQAYFVWYPHDQGSNAEVVAGRYFLIHLPPRDALADDDWDATAVHELIHYISARQSREQKQRLTKMFIAKCPQADRPRALPFLEEPLAVAWASGAYDRYVPNRPIRWDRSWYADPVIDLLGHSLWPIVDDYYRSDKAIDEAFIKVAANQCETLFKAGKALGEASP